MKNETKFSSDGTGSIRTSGTETATEYELTTREGLINVANSSRRAQNAKRRGRTQWQDVLEQLLKPEFHDFLTVLVDNMPKLAEMVTCLTKAYDFAQTVATDKVMINDFVHGIGEFVKSVTEKAKGIAAPAIEANDSAQADTTMIGMFGIVRMLKDPHVQKKLRFTLVFLALWQKTNNNADQIHRGIKTEDGHV